MRIKCVTGSTRNSRNPTMMRKKATFLKFMMSSATTNLTERVQLESTFVLHCTVLESFTAIAIDAHSNSIGPGVWGSYTGQHMSSYLESHLGSYRDTTESMTLTLWREWSQPGEFVYTFIPERSNENYDVVCEKDPYVIDNSVPEEENQPNSQARGNILM